MTIEEAKKELWPIKEIEADIKSVELEIERLMTVATKMTPNYDAPGSPSHKNKIEEALIKIEEYRGRLSRLVVESIDEKTRCLNKVNQIYPRSIRKVLLYYYFMDFTMQKTAEMLDKSYQWTYTMFTSALEEYCKISEKN